MRREERPGRHVAEPVGGRVGFRDPRGSSTNPPNRVMTGRPARLPHRAPTRRHRGGSCPSPKGRALPGSAPVRSRAGCRSHPCPSREAAILAASPSEGMSRDLRLIYSCGGRLPQAPLCRRSPSPVPCRPFARDGAPCPREGPVPHRRPGLAEPARERPWGPVPKILGWRTANTDCIPPSGFPRLSSAGLAGTVGQRPRSQTASTLPRPATQTSPRRASPRRRGPPPRAPAG